MTDDTILVRESEPIAQIVDGNVVLLSIRAGAYLKFNGVGGQIWNMLAEPCQVDAVLDRLAQVYGADVDTMRDDVCAFLDALAERKLVRVLSVDNSR